MNWWREADPSAKRALIAGGLGWMLDSFDVSLYALVLPALMQSLSLDQTTAGSMQSVMLVAAAVGGLVFGVLADRWGRTRALMLSVLLYSIFTAACGLAQTAAELAVFRILLGLGMGGEWASGAALVSETWPDEHRGKALGLMQSSWALGLILAAIANWIVQDVFGWDWRAVFFIGVLPALFTLWVQRRVEEPACWHKARSSGAPVSIRQAIGGPMLGITAALSLMNACTLFGYWGFNTWVPSFLRAPAETGGVGLSNAMMNGFIIVNNIGMWLGYVTFGLIADAVGRKRSYVSYLLIASALVLAYTSTRSPAVLLALGPVTAFFATGYFGGFGAVTAEIYPTAVRATAQGFTYNIGRIVSAFAPTLAGTIARTHGYPAALSLASAAFIAAAMFWFFIPETKGRRIQ
ncbi:MAG TPA: MFS transporter [Vicinamibacterales bacterium]|nr:MFS transporter [Vicinamibacterales bacterium]